MCAGFEASRLSRWGRKERWKWIRCGRLSASTARGLSWTAPSPRHSAVQTAPGTGEVLCGPGLSRRRSRRQSCGPAGLGSRCERLQTVPIPALSREYRKFPLKFTAPVDTDARLEILGTGSGTFHIGTASLMPADNMQGFHAGMIRLFREQGFKMAKWPGGNFVSAYDLYDGLGDADKRPPRFQGLVRRTPRKDSPFRQSRKILERDAGKKANLLEKPAGDHLFGGFFYLFCLAQWNKRFNSPQIFSSRGILFTHKSHLIPITDSARTTGGIAIASSINRIVIRTGTNFFGSMFGCPDGKSKTARPCQVNCKRST